MMPKNIFLKKASLLALALAVTLAAFSADAGALAGATVVTTVVGENSAPVAEDLELSTYRNIQITGAFKSVDPEGESISYELACEPEKGVVTIFDDGTFSYCPDEGKKGVDKFSYVAVDSSGNRSEEADVTVKIEKQSTKVTYADMEGNSSYYGALRLAECGAFIGEQINGKYYFHPEQTVTRGEFLAMCLETCGVKTPEGVTETGFYDDADIASWQKPYVAAALMCEAVSGYTDEQGNAVFCASDPITFAQASVIVNNVLSITDVNAPSEGDAACPAWASQAVVNLESCGITTTDASAISNEMTRADAAEMLSSALAVVQTRSSDTPLILSWLS